MHLALTRLLAVALCLSAPALAQDFYGFSRVLKGLASANKNTDIQPSRFEANVKGGSFQLRMPDSENKTFGDYAFTWTFLDDIQRLERGQEFRVRLNGKRVAGTSEKNTNKISVRSSNSGAELAKKAGIQSPANILGVQSSNSAVAYPVGGNNTVDVTVKLLTISPEETYFTIAFYLSSFPYSSKSLQCTFEAVYVFKKNAVAAAGPLNCPALYGLGVNIGILEYGSLENAKSSFLLGFLDNAIKGAKASGCVPAAEIKYLQDLRPRLQKQERSKAFAIEISAFRQRLAGIIERECQCK